MVIKCSKCKFENPEDKLFYGKCGSKFTSPEEVKVTETLETPKEELKLQKSYFRSADYRSISV